MISSGLVSVTFRRLSPRQIVDLAVQSGLAGIEWGGDVHVPPDNIALAQEVAHMTTDADLHVAAYGSYYRVGVNNPKDFYAVLDTAMALGAPTIRVWAGNVSSAEADVEYRRTIINDSRRIVEMADQVDMTISYEYHDRTLTDTTWSALDLLHAVGHHALRCYWQPLTDGDMHEKKRGLAAIQPYLSNVHVYHRYPWSVQHSLRSGADAWKEYIAVIKSDRCERYALLEFVKDDMPQNLISDAATLNEWL